MKSYPGFRNYFVLIIFVAMLGILCGTAAFADHEVAKLLASDGASNDDFGVSVSVWGNTAVIGAEGDDDNGSYSGSAYIFRFDGSNWIEETKLLASDGEADDRFGCSVSISGHLVIIGARGSDSNGSAYIFRFDGVSWVEEAKLSAFDGEPNEQFGWSVGIFGDAAVIGARHDDDNGSESGSIYVFRYDGSNWDEEIKLLASDGAAEDEFGCSVSISGNTIIAGAHRDDDNGSNSGSAYIFYFDGSNWVEETRLSPADGDYGDYFGHTVGISGHAVVVGAYLDNDKGSNSGSAYIFRFDGADWYQEGSKRRNS